MSEKEFQVVGPENLVVPGRAKAIFEQAGLSGRTQQMVKGATILSQGSSNDVLYYLITGRVKLSAASESGKDAIIRVVSDGDIFGESCLAMPPLNPITATALTHGSLWLLPSSQVRIAARQSPPLSELIIHFLLLHNRRLQNGLANHLTSPSEKRLAYILANLADLSEDHVVEGISQEDLASMTGTTRSRISFFMNRFRRLGYVEFADRAKNFRVLPSRIREVLHS